MLRQKKNLKCKIFLKKLIHSKHLFLINKFIKAKKKIKINFIGYNFKNIKRTNIGSTNLLVKKFSKYLTFFFKKVNQVPLTYIITLRFCSNNIFFTIKKLFNNKKILVLSRSAGMYKLNISKKNLKFNQNLFIKYFFIDLRKKLKKEKKKKGLNQKIKHLLHFKLVAPTKLRARIVRQFLLYYSKRFKININIIEKKIFNGCRPKKKKRKKRQGLRLFK